MELDGNVSTATLAWLTTNGENETVFVKPRPNSALKTATNDNPNMCREVLMLKVCETLWH